MSDTIHVATRKGLFTINRAAAGWGIDRVEFLGVQATMLLHDPRDGALYVALGHGHFGAKLHRSDDGGATWREITAPKFPPKPDDVPDTRCPMRGVVIPWNVEMIWSLEAGGADEPGALWLGTIPGGLFRSEDRGETWNLVRSLWDNPKRAAWFGGGYDYPGIHSIAVDPRPGKSAHVTLGISCGGVWVTEDRGQTWNCRATGIRNAYTPPGLQDDPNTQDPHRLVQCPAAPENLWVQHHNGIFRSQDGSASWREIENVKPSGFGFAVAMHPRDPQTAWFVPGIADVQRVPVDARLVVNRTTDGGKTFTQLTRGLPQRHAYDIVYRHGLDIDATGRRLAMGSTTGSLWISEDAGESWQTVSQNLPPVFCVRFAADA